MAMAIASRVLSARYVLEEQLGEGGMGVVWLAHDRRLKRNVAIKLLRPEIASMPELRERFDREARALASLTHENIVRVYDYAESGENAYLVMEFVDGESLAASVAGRLPVGWERARSCAIPVCRALAYAHEHGVIHRDLTPANILVESATGRVVVTDFGLARVARGTSSGTATAVLIGTPEFWSPEQATGTDKDPSTDMYALGCILFMLLSGRLPFEDEDRLALGLRRAHEDAPSLAAVEPSLPGPATEAVDGLLRRDKDRRPTASQLLETLLPGSAGAADTTRREPAAKPAAPAPPPARPEASTRVFSTVPVPQQSVAKPSVSRRQAWTIAALAALAAVIAAAGAIAVVRAASGASGSSAAPPSRATVTLPRLIGLQLSAGMQRLRSVAAHASVGGRVARVSRIYSEHAAAGVILGQKPAPNARVSRAELPVALTVSRGSAFTAVPAIDAGSDPGAAASRLDAAGFETRHRFTPSWNVRKGRVIGLTPTPGVRVHRPARVTILIASGYPKSVVPRLRGLPLSSAQGVLGARHLRYSVIYVPARWIPVNQVMSQSPPPGSVSVQGSAVQLKVARALEWRRVFSHYGSGAYRSPPFVVGRSWRIQYRCATTVPFSVALTGFTWTGPDGSSDSFTATGAGGLHAYHPSSGAGTFQMEVDPYGFGTTWYFEIDSLE